MHVVLLLLSKSKVKTQKSPRTTMLPTALCEVPLTRFVASADLPSFPPQNVMPGFAFPTMGRLGFTSPSSRHNQRLRLRYYAPLRLPKAHLVKLRFVRLSSHDTLPTSVICVSTHILWARLAIRPEVSQITPGLLVNRYTSASGYLDKETVGSG